MSSILNLSLISFFSEGTQLPTHDISDRILAEFVGRIQDHFVMPMHWRYRLEVSEVSEGSTSENTLNRV